MAFIKRNWIWLSCLCFFIAFGTLWANTSIKGDSYMPPSVTTSITRPFTTPFQPSTTRNAIVSYDIDITAAATLVLGQSGQVIIETSPDGSTWTVQAQPRFGVNSGLVVTVLGTVKVTAFAQRGYWIRIRQNNLVGTPTYGTPTGWEALTN